jgi:hypothetical protein
MAKNKPTTPPSSSAPTAAQLLAEFESHSTSAGGGRAKVPFAGGLVNFDPEDGDAPVGMLTDAQLGNRIRLVCARGYAAIVFPSGRQLYLRVVRPE